MADKLKTLFVDQSGVMGGAELSLLDIARRRRQSGMEGDSVVLLSEGPFTERLAAAGVHAEVLPLAVDVQKASGFVRQLMSVPRVLGVARKLAKRASSHDLFYANTQKAAVVGSVAAKLSGRPLIWHLRDMLDASHFSAANRKVVITLTNLAASRVIANSEATADAYRRAGGRVETIVVHNGVDAAPFQAVADSSVRNEFGIAPKAKLVGIFGRLTPWKGQHVLLDALESEGLEDLHAVIVGEALFTEEDHRYADRLRSRCAEGSLASRVHWLGQRSDVPALMRECDIIAHCSIEPEPFGRVIVEGMLAGKPMVASAAGGALEIVEDGETGRLTPPGDVRALAVALIELTSNPDLASQMAYAGRAAAEQRFRLDDRLAEINEIIASVAQRR